MSSGNSSSRGGLQLLEKGSEVGDLPMLGELAVFDAIELKGIHIDRSACGCDARKVATVDTADRIEDGDPIALGDDLQDRQSNVRHGGMKPGEIALQHIP